MTGKITNQVGLIFKTWCGVQWKGQKLEGGVRWESAIQMLLKQEAIVIVFLSCYLMCPLLY